MTHGATRRYARSGEVLLGLAVAGGEPGDAGRLRHRLGTAELSFLSDVSLPIAAREAAVRDRDVLVRRSVARNRRATAADLATLLEQPDPVVDALVYRHAAAVPWMRRAVLAPGRHTAPGALGPLWEEIRASTEDPPERPHFVAAAVVSAVPELVEHALRVGGARLTRAEQLGGLLGLFRDPERLRGLLVDVRDADPPPPLYPDVAAIATAALDAGPAHLREALTAAESLDGLVAGLRAGEPEPTWRRRLDWAGLHLAHRSQPLPEPAAAALAARPDCPTGVLVDLYRAHPAAVAHAAPPNAALLRAAAHTPGHPELAHLAGTTTAAGLAAESHARLVLFAVTPARTAVGTLAQLPPSTALTELIHRHLGASAPRWATLRATLSRYRGTLTDLLTGIADGSIPAPDAGSAAPTALAKPLRFLLYAADHDDLRDLLPKLPDALLCELLGRGPLPPHALDIALATPDPRPAAAIARNTALDPRDLCRLVARDEPTIDAAVYRHHHAPLTLRRTIASGLPRTPGRTEFVPLDSGLRADLLACPDQRLTTPLLTSGDPDLVYRALHSAVSDDARHFAVVRIHERGGPDAVRRLVDLLGGPDGSNLAATAVAALDSPDGMRELAASAIPFEDPDALPRVFATDRGRNATRRLMQAIVHEPYVYDLPRLVATHRTTPYAPESIDELLRHEHADGEPGRLLRLAQVNRAHGTRSEALNAEPVDRLTAVPLHTGDGVWVDGLVGHGLLDPARLVDTAHPASALLWILPELDPETVAKPIRDAIAALVRTHLAGHPEAVAVALGLLDTFAGTLAELLTVAAQAAGQRPDAETTARGDAEIAEFARVLAAAQAPGATRDQVASTLPIPPRQGPNRDRTCSLAAAHLLRSLVPGAPIPSDPSVLAAFADTSAADAPGLYHPEWLRTACATAPAERTRELVPRMRRDFQRHASAALRYRAGLIGPAHLLAAMPARALNAPRPGAFAQLLRRPLTRAVRALVAERLGTDPDRWLAALAAMETDSAELPLPELLEHAAGQEPPAPALLSPEAASLLVYADLSVLRAVIPHFKGDAPLALVNYANQGRFVHDDLVEYVLELPDRAAALALAQGRSRSACARYVRDRLLSLRDPMVDDRLYGDVKRSGDTAERRRILSRAVDDPGPVSPRLRARLLEPGVFSKYRADALLVTVEAADPEVVAAALTALRGKLSLPEQLAAARNSLRFGGPDHLRSLIDAGLLGAGAIRIAKKALDAGGVDAGVAVLTARLDRERSTARLVAKLRTCERGADAERVLEQPYARDWSVLAAEHAQEPFAADVWRALAELPDAPDHVVLAAVQRLYSGDAIDVARRGPEVARAVVAWVIPHGATGEWYVVVETLLEEGLLTAHDLVHEVGCADRVLNYVADARVRIDLPEAVRVAADAACAEIAALAGELLGTEDRSWQRLFAVLTDRDEYWRRAEGPAAGVANMLAHAGRAPLILD
ncbi:hypothetical protein [Embleya sp. NBC_00896]|uniref:hypothetical protein n=1 Tax=Embleya sp. NBC_00896 TaxID=2975961 RepID=UPI002F90AD4F|nr:hypothetical protein OG928_37740 [Embleya sp. NBC_00896]